MIRAFQLGGPSLLVIRKRQSQRRHADEVENPAGFDVAFRLRVPLRQHDHRVARSPAVFALRGKEPGARDVVCGRRRGYRAAPGKLIALEAIVRDWRQGVEFFACRHYAGSVFAEKFAWVVAIYVVDDVRQTPFKRTNKPIDVYLMVPALAPV